MPVQYFKNKVLDSQVEYISKNENSETIQKCTDTVSCGITISFPVELKNKIKTFNKEGVDTTERKCYVLKGNFEFDIKFEYKNSKVNEVSCYNGND